MASGARENAVDIEPQPDTDANFAVALDAAIRRGYQRAVIVCLARLIAVPSRRPTGAGTAVIAVMIMGAWPYLLNLVLVPVAPGLAFPDPPANLWALSDTAVCVSMLGLGWSAWWYAERLVPPVADLLAESPRRLDLLTWLRRRQRLTPQLALSAVGTAPPIYLVILISSRPHSPIHPTLMLYVQVAWTGLLGANTLYWLMTAAEFPLRLSRCPRLRLAWIDPARTPAIVRLCHCYVLVAIATAFGVVLTEISALVLADNHSDAVLRSFIVSFPVAAAMIALYVGVLPQVTLARIVRRYLNSVTEPLMAPVCDPAPESIRFPGVRDTIEAYRHFAALHTLPIKTTAIVQYVGGIIASLIVYLLQQSVF